MSAVHVGTAPLSDQDRRWVARSRIAQACLLALAAAVCLGLLAGLVMDLGSISLGELVFMGVIGLVVALMLGLLVDMSIKTWRDLRANEKRVVRGKVVAVDVRMSSYGAGRSIRLGENFIASDPLYSPMPGFFGTIQVGDWVEVSYLARSGRTLSVIPYHVS